MGLLAVIPVLGTFIIWIPADIFLLLEGSAEKALLLALFGAIVVGGIDNLLYPMLVGNRLRMHTIIAFISIVGGLIVFDPAGLILGPVVFTITKLLLEIWSSQNAVANGWLRQLVLAITQAMCQYRKQQGIDGPLFLGANVMIAPDIASTDEAIRTFF